MLERYLDSPVTRERLRTCPAADHIDAFTGWLHLQGYKPVSIHTLANCPCRLGGLDGRRRVPSAGPRSGVRNQ